MGVDQFDTKSESCHACSLRSFTHSPCKSVYRKHLGVRRLDAALGSLGNTELHDAPGLPASSSSDEKPCWPAHSEGGVKPPHSKALRAYCRKMRRARNGNVDSIARGDLQ